jgi:hypothetical protein
VHASAPRLIALCAALLLLSFGAFWLTRQAVDVAPGQSGLALGLAWLKQEYQLDDATFEQVTSAHRSYFRECEKRCHELEDVNRHFLSELEQHSAQKSDLDAIQVLQESICHDCRLAMINHVHQVATLMPEPAGRRFIADVRLALNPPQPRQNRSTR